MDTLTAAERSERMSRVKNKNTTVEWNVRRLVHGLGYRYRLHRAGLPGRPDLVFPSRRKVLFVHGCFWHMHSDCKLARLPKSRLEFWVPKLERNRERDRDVREQLIKLGWKVMVVWECELRDKADLVKRIRTFLDE